MNKTDLQSKLYELQDLKYRDMQIKIIPTIEPGAVIGVRTPELKAMYATGNGNDADNAAEFDWFRCRR